MKPLSLHYYSTSLTINISQSFLSIVISRFNCRGYLQFNNICYKLNFRIYNHSLCHKINNGMLYISVGKLPNLADCELFAKIFLSNVFGICTDCSLFTTFSLPTAFTLYARVPIIIYHERLMYGLLKFFPSQIFPVYGNMFIHMHTNLMSNMSLICY